MAPSPVTADRDTPEVPRRLFTKMANSTPLVVRFTRQVALGDGCWEWLGHRNQSGYGRFWLLGRYEVAHRVSYELFVGPIPVGLTLDHRCRNRGCVRPDHLEPATLRENILRGQGVGVRNAAKTHCPQGHPYDATNTHRTAQGRRRCRACEWH